MLPFYYFFHVYKFHLAAWKIVFLDINKKKGFFQITEWSFQQ